MQRKDFGSYLKKRFNQNEIDEIEQLIRREKKIVASLQEQIAHAINTYLKENNITKSELINRLHLNRSQMTHLKKDTALITLGSLAHLFALLGYEPQVVLKKVKATPKIIAIKEKDESGENNT